MTRWVMFCALVFGCAGADPEIDEMPRNRLPPHFHAPEVFQHDDSRTMFDDFTMRAARQVHKANPGLPLYQEVPLRNNPMWSGNNELGIEQSFAPDDTNSQVILKLQEWGEPELWTVCLGLEFDPNLVDASAAWNVIARIDFGVGGVVQTVEVDWLNGACITLPMNALTVRALYETAFFTTPVSIPPSLRLRVSLSRGDGATESRPTRSFFLISDAGPPAFNIISLNIPKFAKTFNLVPTDGATPFDGYSPARVVTAFSGVTLNPTSGPGGVAIASWPFSQFVTSRDVANVTICGQQFISLPPFARSLNFSGAASFSGVVQFELGI